MLMYMNINDSTERRTIYQSDIDMPHPTRTRHIVPQPLIDLKARPRDWPRNKIEAAEKSSGIHIEPSRCWNKLISC